MKLGLQDMNSKYEIGNMPQWANSELGIDSRATD